MNYMQLKQLSAQARYLRNEERRNFAKFSSKFKFLLNQMFPSVGCKFKISLFVVSIKASLLKFARKFGYCGNRDRFPTHNTTFSLS